MYYFSLIDDKLVSKLNAPESLIFEAGWASSDLPPPHLDLSIRTNQTLIRMLASNYLIHNVIIHNNAENKNAWPWNNFPRPNQLRVSISLNPFSLSWSNLMARNVLVNSVLLTLKSKKRNAHLRSSFVFVATWFRKQKHKSGNTSFPRVAWTISWITMLGICFHFVTSRWNRTDIIKVLCY